LKASRSSRPLYYCCKSKCQKATGFYSSAAEIADITTAAPDEEMRVITTPDTIVPEVQLLSNGNYHVMVSNAGGGYSRWKDKSVTRWREDGTCDNWGTFCYIRDLDANEFWSCAHQPTAKKADNYEAVFSQGRVEFKRTDNNIETHTEIIVSPEDDIEIRRIQITNRSRTKKRIDITSYAEVVMANAMADASHPAFSNLFVQTEIEENQNAIICTRRPRAKDEQTPFMFHIMKMNTATNANISYETDRSKFIGRGNSVAAPIAMQHTAPLSGSYGPVLDPVVAIQYRLNLAPDETVKFDMIFGMTETYDLCKGLIDRYQDKHIRDRALNYHGHTAR